MQPILTARSFRHISGQFQVWFVCAGFSDAVKTADFIVGARRKLKREKDRLAKVFRIVLKNARDKSGKYLASVLESNLEKTKLITVSQNYKSFKFFDKIGECSIRVSKNGVDNSFRFSRRG